MKFTNMHVFVSFVGVVFLILGIYNGIRTVVNLKLYPKYPTYGATPFLPMMGQPYGQREEDCSSYPQTFYDQDGKQRSANTEEKELQNKQEENCLSGVKEARKNAKVNDISNSALLLFLGTGILLSKKFLF